MPATDSLGTWGEVGTIAFADTDWHLLSSPSVGGELFRFTYSYDAQRWENKEGYRSWIWMRFVWVRGSLPNIVSSARRLWPKAEIELKEFPIPQDFVDAGLTLREIQVKLRPYGRSRWPHQTAIPVTLKVEERLK